MKKIFLFTFILLAARFSHAVPIRYVQISTGAVTQQSGGFNVAGGTLAVAQAATLRATQTFTMPIGSTMTVLGSSVTIGVVGGTVTVPSILNLTGELKPSLTSSTSGQSLISQGPGQPPKFQWAGRIGAMGLGTITNSTSTTATTFVNTNLTCSITPLTAGSTIFVFVSGFSQSGNGDQGNLTLARASTNIAGATGFYRQISPTALSIMAGSSFFGADAVTTAGVSQTYTVQMKSGSGASYQFCESNARCTILAIEIAGP